jgi:transposase
VERLIEEDHSARAIWELVGRLDLSLYYAGIAAVEGRAGREHTDPQVLISLWLYGYSRGISSGREMARRCEYEPAFQWLCGLEPISHRTLSGFRSDHQAALNNLFVQVLGMLSAEGLITLERVTLDGTKIKANAGGNTFRRKETLEAHLQLAREQVRLMEKQAAEEEQRAKRQVAARRRAARQRQSRLEAAVREVERLQREKKEDRDSFVARASRTDPEAHVMRNGEGGTVPSYNVQLVTDAAHGLIVNVEATTDAVDHRQLAPAWDAAPGRWLPMATTPITPRSRRRRIPEWIFMDRGRKVGSPANAMPKAAAPRFWPARSPMMPDRIASLARREKR